MYVLYEWLVKTVKNFPKIFLSQKPVTLLAKAEKWSFSNKDKGLWIAPELTLTGYPAGDYWLHPQLIQDCAAQAAVLAAEIPVGQGLIIGSPWVIDGKLYNAALLLTDGQVQVAALKQHLPTYDVFDEARYFTPGHALLPIDWQGVKLGVLICEDMWYPEPALQAKAKGAEVLLVINASPFDRYKRAQRLFQARARVQATLLPLAYVNYSGGQDDIVFDGGSFALNATGDLIALANLAATELPVDFNATAKFADTDYTAIDQPFTKDLIVLALRDYVQRNGFKKILLGLSGGIDSALVACLAAEALGAENVTVIGLPYHYTSEASRVDAQALAGKLGIALQEIPIEQPVTAFHGILKQYISETTDLPWQNLQSRIRAVILMALSNAQNALLLTTSNKSELAVGYGTLYGDMCGAFNPLKDLYKTEVYTLAKACYGDIIPERIFTRPPTAELKPEQVDQDNLPPYEILDAILQRLVEGYQNADQIVAAGYDRLIVDKTIKLFHLAEYKRYQAPPGPKLTTRSFGREWRYPLTVGGKK